MEAGVRRLREALYVLQELLLRNLLYDALRTDNAEHLNFFRAYRGGMMDGVVVDWWKIFGNYKEPSHWKNLLPTNQHEKISKEICFALSELNPKEDFDDVWKRVGEYRNTAVAHLDFDEDKRARYYPRLAPLRMSSEIVYRYIFETLSDHETANGLPNPEGVSGKCRKKSLAHYVEIVGVARNALSGYGNSPKDK